MSRQTERHSTRKRDDRTRRTFLKQISMTAAGFVVGAHPRLPLWSASPSEKLHLGIIGVSGRGGGNFSAVASAGEHIAALCDIDDRKLGIAAEGYPQAKTHNDFRRVIAQKDIDAVVISTPDHTHAPATVAALQSGKHVYCEKPLTHSVYEARVVAKTAKSTGLATQMGTQIHAKNNYRRVVEVIGSGAIGPVTKVHVWEGKSWSGGDIPKDRPPVPHYIHWDLWLGPAPQRPYHPCFLPAQWRRYWDFGGGTLADMACHYMDLPFWALHLRHPISVECTAGSPVHSEGTGDKMVVEYQFPARGTLPPVEFTWYDGGVQPAVVKELLPEVGSGVLFEGSKGKLFASYNVYKLFPEKDYEGYEPPLPYIPDSIGHHAEWLQACKTGSPTTCSFEYSGALTEAVLLGNVAYRIGKKLHWNGQALKATNCPEADQYLRREYRQGWLL